MGPSRLFHKDRSQHSLLNSQDANEKRQYHPSPIDSPLHSPGLPPPAGPPPEYDDDEEAILDEAEHDYARTYRQGDVLYAQQTSHGHHPTRSQSQRSPSLINTNQPTIHLVRPTHGAASTPSSAIEPEEPDRYYYQRPDPIPAPQKEDKRQKRRFFGLGSSKEPAAPTNKLGRSRSVRAKEQYPEQHIESQNIKHTQYHHHHWGGSTHVSPTDDEEEEDEGGAGLHPSHHHSGLSEKDPLRSPGFPPPISHQEYTHGKSNQQAASQSPGTRKDLERQVSYQSPWERAAYQVVQQTHPDSAPQHFQHRSQQHESLHQHWQEQPDSRPSSRQSLEPPPSTTSHPYGHHARASSSQASSTSYMPGSMGPPQGQPQPPSRRSSEAQQSQQSGQSRDGLAYQPYNQGSNLSSNAPPAYSTQLAPQGQNPRGGAQPSPMPGDQGRNTPPPNRSRDDLSNLDVPQLLARHDELQDKYRKVKKYYFDKDAHVQQLQGQVLQLQNTLAHQRLSLHRTSLDDNEYSNRFSRLDGAINNLAFNLRREWRSVPPWLAPYVNRDAHNQPTREMTAVGRAAISRWLVEEVLDRYFHPGIEPGFSSQLKLIEKNLRRYSPPASTEEEKDTLVSKISNWRLSTLDGLQDALISPQAGENRASLTALLTEKLTASLAMLLKDPPPPGLEGGVSMIVELAIGIAANLPLESRDVFVVYVLPGQLVNETYMKVESGLPTLNNPGDGPVDQGDIGSLLMKANKQGEDTGSIDSRDTGTSNGNGSDEAPAQPSQQNQQSPSAGQAQPVQQKQDSMSPPPQQSQTAKKKSMFGSLIGGSGSTSSGPNSAGKKGGSSPQQGQQQNPSSSSSSTQQQVPPGAGSQQQQQQQQQQVAGVVGQGSNGGAGGGPGGEERVRFSTFMAVEVRARNVLIKAPVYIRE